MNNVYVATVPQTQLTYTTTDRQVISTGGSYEFKVTAVNAIGEGSQSIGRTIIAAMRPYQVLKPTKKSASASYIEVQWTSPENGGSEIKGYVVYKEGDDGVHVYYVAPNVYSLVIANSIIAGDTYQVSVSAYNDIGEGAQSDQLAIIAA